MHGHDEKHIGSLTDGVGDGLRGRIGRDGDAGAHARVVYGADDLGRVL
jgi:hypothetical protein